MTASGPTKRSAVAYIGDSVGRPLGTSHIHPLRKSARPTGRKTAVLHSNSSRPLDNKLLAALPRNHFDLLVPHITTVALAQGLVISEAGDEVADVLFPHDGMLSMLAVMRDGKAIETATVGNEGVVGAMAGGDGVWAVTSLV